VEAKSPAAGRKRITEAKEKGFPIVHAEKPLQREKAARKSSANQSPPLMALISELAYQSPIRGIMTSQDYQWSGKDRLGSACRMSLMSLFTILRNAPMRICLMPVCAYAGMRPCKQALYAPMRLSAYAAMRLKPYAGMPVCAYASKRRMRIGAYAGVPVCAYASKSLLIMRRNSNKNENHSQ
jgi:hypothetical protein